MFIIINSKIKCQEYKTDSLFYCSDYDPESSAVLFFMPMKRNLGER